MKINLNQQDLQKSLSYCQGVVEKRSTLPILSNVLLDASNSKLTVTATDLNSGELKIFKEGELYLPILASAAFPGIFTPVEIENNTYVDGGVINNFPVDLLDNCDVKIGSYTNKVDFKSRKLKHSYDVAGRAYAINQYHQDKIKFHQCDILIEPELYHYGLFSFKGLRDIFNIGYESACKAIEASDIVKK